MRRPVVVKLGSSLVVGEDGRPRADVLAPRAREIAALVGAGTPVCVVSSGAIALGLARMGLARRPRRLPRLQAASALGQAALQRAWDDALAAAGATAAQVLLTAAETADRRAYVNVRNALGELFSLRVVPVVNENDATATDEIGFGDNDMLAAHVAVLCRARLLVLLTSAEGVLTAPGGTLIADGAAARTATFGAATATGTGGMASKVGAAELASAGGVAAAIASGTADGVLTALAAGEPRGTRFAADDGSQPAFKLWLRLGKRIAARVRIDEGAHLALTRRGASLLAVGVVSWDTEFAAGDGVEILAPDGSPCARGISSVDSAEILDRRRDTELVHRNRLVLL
ncbi:MAG TPA: glutamate 5-kinase [Gaiellaceae bacterium]|nr:glutamate 5-kinase [Gaiellaceae bacterium]